MTDDDTPRMTTTQAIYFDVPPWTGGDEDTGPLLSPELNWLPDAFLDRLDELLRDVDLLSCWDCRAGVGFVLVERGDREVVEWSPVGLARQDGGPVALLCEACAPGDIPVEPISDELFALAAPTKRWTVR